MLVSQPSHLSQPLVSFRERGRESPFKKLSQRGPPLARECSVDRNMVRSSRQKDHSEAAQSFSKLDLNHSSLNWQLTPTVDHLAFLSSSTSAFQSSPLLLSANFPNSSSFFNPQYSNLDLFLNLKRLEILAGTTGKYSWLKASSFAASVLTLFNFHHLVSPPSVLVDWTLPPHSTTLVLSES